MKIISGSLKGRDVKSPEIRSTHPMGAREKLALMNSIAPYVEGAVVLDGYAGSGALGIECLSRGANHAIFIENNSKCVKTIKENIKNLGLQDEAEVIKTNINDIDKNILTRLNNQAFDVVILDPPYDSIFEQDFSSISDLIKKEGIVILSHPATFNPESLLKSTFKNFKLKSTKKYAACHISMFIGQD